MNSPLTFLMSRTQLQIGPTTLTRHSANVPTSTVACQPQCWTIEILAQAVTMNWMAILVRNDTTIYYKSGKDVNSDNSLTGGLLIRTPKLTVIPNKIEHDNLAALSLSLSLLTCPKDSRNKQ